MSKNKILNEYLNSHLHYGSLTNEWNPKMAPYILLKKDGRHTLDLVKTKQLMEVAGNVLEAKSKAKEKILFVGTTKETSSLIEQYAKRTNSFYINYRWLGGMLTNWITLQKRISRLKELEYLNESQEIKKLSKKDQNSALKKINSLNRLFSGIKNMHSLPDICIFTNQNKNLLGIYETLKLGIPSISIIDTNSDPSLVPYPIPANNNSQMSVEYILNYLSDRICNANAK